MEKINIVRDLPVLYLWRLTLQSLTLDGTKPHVFLQHSASRQRLDRRKVLEEAHERFTAEWWAGNLVTEIVYIGELHMIDGIPLYEED